MKQSVWRSSHASSRKTYASEPKHITALWQGSDRARCLWLAQTPKQDADHTAAAIIFDDDMASNDTLASSSTFWFIMMVTTGARRLTQGLVSCTWKMEWANTAYVVIRLFQLIPQYTARTCGQPWQEQQQIMIQTYERFKRTLFIRTKTICKCSG